MHPRDHVKLADAPIGADNDFGPSRALAQGYQRTLHRDRLNFNDEPISDGPFLHRALDRRQGATTSPSPLLTEAPPDQRMSNAPPWFQYLGMR